MAREELRRLQLGGVHWRSSESGRSVKPLAPMKILWNQLIVKMKVVHEDFNI